MKKGVNFSLICYFLTLVLIQASGNHIEDKRTSLTEYFQRHDVNPSEEISIEIENINIKDWNSEFFMNFTKLETLFLRNIRGLPFVASDSAALVSDSIKTFTCHGSEILKIGRKTLGGMRNLEKLTLNGNNMTDIVAEAFVGNPNLQVLSLAGNDFKELPEKLVENLTLTSFDFSNNRLYKFPEAKPFLISKSLKQFKCSACGITQIYVETFSKLPNLHTLILRENSIHQIHENHLPSKLHTLNLELNPMNVLPLKILQKPMQKFCLGGSDPAPWSEDNDKFVAMYEGSNLQSKFSCQFSPKITFKVKPTLLPKSTTTQISDTTEEPTTLNPALLDALIASYLLVCLLTEVALIVVFGSYVAKLLRSKSKEFDYSSNVINPSDIYKIN